MLEPKQEMDDGSSAEDDKQFTDEDYEMFLRFMQDEPGKFKKMADKFLSRHPRWKQQDEQLASLKKDLEELEEELQRVGLEGEKSEQLLKEIGKAKVDFQEIGPDKVYISSDGLLHFEGEYQRIISLDELKKKMKGNNRGSRISSVEEHGLLPKVVTKGPSMGIQTETVSQPDDVIIISDDDDDEPKAQTDQRQNTGQKVDQKPSFFAKKEESAENEIEEIFVQNPAPAVKIPGTGEIQRPKIKTEEQVYAASVYSDLKSVWKAAKVLAVYNDTTVNKSYRVKFLVDDKKVFEFIEGWKVAYSTSPNVQLVVGERVAAYIKDEVVDFKQLFSGTIAEPMKPSNKFRYLIFFDKEEYRYVEHDQVFLIHQKPNAFENLTPDNGIDEDHEYFIREYVSQWPDRVMLRLQNQEKIKVKFRGNWEHAIVLKTDGSLFQVEYVSHALKGRREWIYRGSPRIFDIYDKIYAKRRRSRMAKSTSRPVRSLSQRSHSRTFQWNTAEDDQENQEPKDEEQVSIGDKLKKVKLKQTARKSIKSSGSDLPQQKEPKFSIVNVVKKPKVNFKNKDFVPHPFCGPFCLEDSRENLDFRDQNPFFIPILCGWRREKFRFSHNIKSMILYRAPCGRRLKKIEEVYEYLMETQSTLDIDLFTFSVGLRLYKPSEPVKANYYVEDITNGIEPKPISCVNSVDGKVINNVTYYNKRFPHKDVHFAPDPDFLACCDCTDNCSNKNTCACQQFTIEVTDVLPKVRPANPGYVNKRLLEFVMTGIFECNERCSCNSRCPNRVVQNGIKCQLQLVMTMKKGWGVRVLHDVPKGTFICVYEAMILNDEIADLMGKEEGDEYLAQLDYIDICEHHKEDYESDVEDPEDSDYDDNQESDDDDDDKLWCTSRKRRKRNEEDVDDLMYDDSSNSSNSRDSKYRFRKRNELQPKQKFLPIRQYFNEDFQYLLDAKKKGNIGRYLNHSCDPNCFVQNVFIDTHDLRFPFVAFFAKRHIPAYSELTWDYNYEVGSVPGKKLYCHCQSTNCSKRLL